MNARIRIGLSLLAALATGACVTSEGGPPATRGGNLPDAVFELAAPGQDVDSARLMPDDSCYWYRHTGPVETTLLPLRTPNGSPICARVPEA